jgi:hypothetical protein
MLDKLKEALGEKASEFNFDDFQIMPKSDFNTLVDGYKSEIEATKDKSQKIGKEILLKELKNELGFEYEQRKNPENLKKAYVEKFGKSDEVDADYTALETKFNSYREEKESEIESIKSTYKAESDNKIILDTLRSNFENFEGKTNYKTDDLVTIAKAKGEFSVIDGKVYQSKDGEVIKNDLLQGVTSDAFVDSMMKDGYIKKAEGGRVIGDETKGGKYSMDEFIASQEAQGVNVNGQEFAENMDAAMKNGTLDI